MCLIITSFSNLTTHNIVDKLFKTKRLFVYKFENKLRTLKAKQANIHTNLFCRSIHNIMTTFNEFKNNT